MESHPKKQSKNIFKHFFCFSFISETRRKSSRTASSKEHECATVILFQTNMLKQRVINQPNGTQRSCSERGRSQNNGKVTGALFFSSPRLALRAKCRVRLAWLGKRVLCRLISRLSTSEHSNLHFGRSTGILTNRKQIYASFWKHFLQEPKKMNATYLKTSNQLLLNRLPLRKTVCSTYPQNFSLQSQQKLSPIHLLYLVTLCLKFGKVSRNYWGLNPLRLK